MHYPEHPGQAHPLHRLGQRSPISETIWKVCAVCCIARLAGSIVLLYTDEEEEEQLSIL